MNKFHLDEKVLDSNLFNYESPKVGPQTYLNINYLPHFMSHLISKLTRKEQSCIITFDVQTYILELCLYHLRYKNLKELTNGIIRELRMSPKFWISNSEAQMDVQLRVKILNIIQSLQEKQENPDPLQIEHDFENFRRSVSQLDFDKLDFRNDALKFEEVQALIKAKSLREDSSSKQMEAVERYYDYIKGVTAIKNEKYEFVRQGYTNGPKTKRPEDNLPGNVFDWMSRCNAFDFTAQRETRQQSRPMGSQEQLSHRDIRVLVREQQRIEMENKRTIWVPNNIYQYQKIDIIILPHIYQFILKPNSIYDRRHLRVQNLAMYLVMTDQEHFKQKKMKKSILLGSEGDHKTSQKQFLKFLQVSNDRIMNDFNQHCANQGISLSAYFSSTPASYRKELILIRNILLLVFYFAQMLLPDEMNYQLLEDNELDQKKLLCSFDDDQISKQLSNEGDQPEESQQQEIDQENGTSSKRNNFQSYQKWRQNQNDYFYLQVLQQLELYYAIPLDQYKCLLQTYIQNIEIIYTSKKDHMKEYFQVLRLSKQNNIVGCFTSEKDALAAANNYVEYIDAPTTQEKRSYIFHQSNRTQWNEEQYKLFLEGLHKYFEIVVNNKRIAKHMGGDVDANHVRFVKGNYLRQLKKRAQELNKNRKELVKEDIEKFDISVFDFISKKQVNNMIHQQKKSISKESPIEEIINSGQGIQDEDIRSSGEGLQLRDSVQEEQEQEIKDVVEPQ